MNYVLDTNVVSEMRRSQPAQEIRAWMASTPPGAKFISAMTIGELRKGVELLGARDPVRAASLRKWLGDVTSEFRDRTIEVDAAVASEWGRLSAAQPIEPVDGLIAATALVRSWTVVTRNVRHFEGTGVATLNPFEPQS